MPAIHIGGVMIHYQDRWAVVTGASSGLGRGLAARLADRGMSLVLTGRNEARLDEVAHQIRRATPRVKVETVAADLSTRSGVSALLDHVGDRPIEVLVNNAGFGSYGPFAEADADREADEVAVDVSAVDRPGSRVPARNARPRQRRDSQRRVHDRVPARALPGGVRGEQGIRAVVQPGPMGRGPCGRRGGHRTVSGSLSFAKIPSGAQVVDLSDLTTPRSGYSCRSTGRRSPCLQDVNQEAIPRLPSTSFPVRSPVCRSPLGGRRDTVRAAERPPPSASLADASLAAGPAGHQQSRVAVRPGPLDPPAPLQSESPGIPCGGGDRGRDRSLRPAREEDAPAEWQSLKDLAGPGAGARAGRSARRSRRQPGPGYRSLVHGELLT